MKVPTRVGKRAHDAARHYRQAGFWRGRSLGAELADTCVRRGEAAALLEGDRVLSFAALHDRVRALAAGLGAAGIGPGDAVAYQLPNWWEATVTLLATVSLGARSIPIVPILRAREVGMILAETRPRVVVVPGRHRRADYVPLFQAAYEESGLGTEAAPLLVVARAEKEPKGGTTFEALLESGAAAPVPIAGAEVDPGDVAVVIYTSGSTAAPKGAMHSHETLGAELRSLGAVHPLGDADRVLMPSPVTHISGVVHAILAPALLGTSAVLMDQWQPARALELIERHRVTYMIGAPTFLQEMLAQPDLERHDLSSLRLFSCGGASVPAELMRVARARLPGLVTKRVYGSSEFPTISTTDAHDAVTRGLDTEGRALPGVEIRICDEDGRRLPPRQEGEIRARGPDCFLGYVDARLDAETFDAEGFLRTGDLGVLDEDGYLTVTGRAKDIIVRKGEKISAREVEDLIATHPAVAEVAVVPVGDAETGERACACIRLAPGAEAPSLESLVDFLRERDLTPQKLPERLVVRDDLPRAPSGKVHKKLLREEVERHLAEGRPGR